MQKTASSCYRCKEAGQYGCPASSFLKMPPLFLPKRPLSDMYAVPNQFLGNAGTRDSINTKVFEEEGVGFGEGEEKLSKKVSPPPPQSLHILFKTPRPSPSLRQDRRFRRAFRIRGYGWPAPGGGPDGCWLRAPSLPPAPCGSSKGSAACYKCSSKRADSS